MFVWCVCNALGVGLLKKSYSHHTLYRHQTFAPRLVSVPCDLDWWHAWRAHIGLLRSDKRVDTLRAAGEGARAYTLVCVACAHVVSVSVCMCVFVLLICARTRTVAYMWDSHLLHFTIDMRLSSSSAAGISRSVTMTIAYMMRHHKYTLPAAYVYFYFSITTLTLTKASFCTHANTCMPEALQTPIFTPVHIQTHTCIFIPQRYMLSWLLNCLNWQLCHVD